jgi:uncharacterized membrane protein (DUF2068 family)
MPRHTASRTLPAKARSGNSSYVLIVIGLFKLFKAILLVIAGIGAARLMHKDIASTVQHWTQLLRVDPDNRYIHSLLVRILRVSPRQLRELSVGTFFYAGIFATEGVGLLLRKRWAEYFTIVSTGALLPLEIFELARRFTLTRLAVLIVNALIVWYLARRVRSR